MSTNQENIATDNRFPISIPINVSFDNRPVEMPNGETISFYTRLHKYAKHKGISEQDVIRYAVSMLLDKVGY